MRRGGRGKIPVALAWGAAHRGVRAEGRERKSEEKKRGAGTGDDRSIERRGRGEMRGTGRGGEEGGEERGVDVTPSISWSNGVCMIKRVSI
eukprot:1019243-Amorphochlora_amoeboformis.AAC.1